jgi:hypothetical protein
VAEDSAAAASLGWLGLVDLDPPRATTGEYSPGAVAQRLAVAPAVVALVVWLAGGTATLRRYDAEDPASAFASACCATAVASAR